MSQVIDMIGQRFGRLTVIDRAENSTSKSGRKRTRWLCQCDCGTIKSIDRYALINGSAQSCGCLKKELLSKKQSTHKETKTRLYRIWSAMKRRCYNQNTPAYPDYGGRGIVICDAWKNSYESFRDWSLDNGYSSSLTIDRIDNNGNYEPGNCRWVGSDAQANNRRSNCLYTYKGETHNISEWASIYNIPYKTLHNRLKTAGWSIEKSLTT